MARKAISSITLFFVALSLWSGAAYADLNPSQEAEAQEIFASVMSPFCVARSLRDCPSSAAHDLQNQIRDQIAAGKNRTEIMQGLYTSFGQKIRATPDQSAVGVLGWLAPIGFAALGIVVLLLWLARRSDRAPAVPSEQNIDPEMEKRINDELSKF